MGWPYSPSRMVRIFFQKILNKARAVNDTEQELSFTADGSAKWYTWKTVWQVLGVKSTLTLGPNNSTTEHLSQIKGSLCSHQNLYTNIHGSRMHNLQSCKQTKHLSIGEWLNKLSCVHTMEYYSAIKRNEWARQSEVNNKSDVMLIVILDIMWWKWHFIFVVFFPQTHNLI